MSSKAFYYRCFFLSSLIVAGLSLLSARLIQIQVIERQKYAERARATYDRSEILPGLRGKIVDRHDEVLAKSIALSTVMVDAKLLNDPVVVARSLAYEQASNEADWDTLNADEQARKVRAYRSIILEQEPAEVIVSRHLARALGSLARPLGLRKDELRERIEGPMLKGRQYYPIAKDLPEDVAESLRELMETHHLKGFRFENRIRRWYTSPNLAAHLLGYTGEDVVIDEAGDKTFRQVGKFGIEAAMEEYLHGTDGVWDHLNIPMPGEEGSMIPPVHGLNVQLTLDTGIQSIIEEELDAGLNEFIAKRGCVVVLDPSTGELLAMANRPTFNLNEKENLQEAAMNYALQGVYEPGSTFKVVGIGGALDQNLVSPQTMIYCHDGYYHEGHLKIPDHHPYGMLSVSSVIQKSSNIGAFKITRQLGTTKFFEYIERFGFGQKTGILLSGESSGVVNNTGNLIDFSRASYGYALNVTPLQVASAYAAIANDGELMRPRVVRAIVANDGTVIEQFKPELVRRVVRESTAKHLRDAMIRVIEEGGTATRAAVPGFKVAGKTGTAKRVVNGQYQDDHYTVSFAGMMPAEDPKFVCLVVVDDPLTEEVKRYGGTIAAPIFAKIAARLSTHLNLTPTEPIENTPAEEQLAGAE